MKGFLMDESGDVVIENGVVQMAHGVDLTMQKIKCVLGTQKGEWFLNWDEGINHNNILGKKRYARKNTAIEKQYVDEIATLKQGQAENNELNERLAKRLDGVSQ